MKLSYLARKMIFTILIIALICILASIVYYRSLDFLPFLFGVLIGSAVSIAKVVLLERAVDKALSMEKNRVRAYIGIQYILRLFLSGVVLILGALVPQINLWGVVAGILAFQLAAYNVKFISNS